MATYQDFANYCESELNLHQQLIVNNRKDPNEEFYKSLPLCIIDAVFSIGVKYKSAEKATAHFIDHFNLDVSRTYPIQKEYTVNDFIHDMNSFSSFDEAAVSGFNNRQRTSSRNGILKAEACFRVAEVFQKHNVDTLKDFNNYTNTTALDRDILAVKGQGSGIMLRYLHMLAGRSDEVKPDRHVVNFIQNVFPHLSMSPKYHDAIKQTMHETVHLLQSKYPTLTERFLDVLIWEYMRNKKT